MASKDKKKKQESFTRENRPKGVSKNEWDKARKAEGRDPYAKFFSDPVADRKKAEARRVEIVKQTETQKQTQISPDEKAQADDFINRLRGTGQPTIQEQFQNASQGRSQLSEPEKQQADSFLQKIGNGLKSFATEAKDNLKFGVKNPIATLKEVPNAFREVTVEKPLDWTARPITRSAVSTIGELTQPITKQDTFDPKTLGRTGEFIFGKDPITTYSRGGKDLGESFDVKNPIAQAGIASALVALDFAGFKGNKKKAAEEIASTVAQNSLKKEAAEQVSKKSLSKIVAQQPQLDKKSVSKIVNGTPKTQVTETVDPLIQEAKKYKSAEEFVNRMELYRSQGGTQTSKYNPIQNAIDHAPYTLDKLPKQQKESYIKFNPLLKDDKVKIYRVTPGGFEPGDFVFARKEDAVKYLEQQKGITKGAIKEKIVKSSELSPAFDRNTQYNMSKKGTWLYKDTEPTFHQTEMIYVPENAPKTKSQLTDIWNKANTKNARPRVEQSVPSTVPAKMERQLQSETQTIPGKQASQAQIIDNKVLPSSKSINDDVIPPSNQKLPDLSTPEAKQSYKQTLFDKFRTTVQDSWYNAKKLEKTGVRNKKNINPSEAQELYYGRVGSRLEDLKKKVQTIDEDIVKTNKNFKENDLKADVNRYLQATHAPERNAIHGDGAAGMTNAQAQEVLAEIGNSKASKEIKRIAGEVKKLNDQTLDILLDGQVIDKETYNKLRTAYKNHVPLNRIMPEDDDIVQSLTGGKGFNVKGSGIKRAKGSEREVADILTNTYSNLGEAIARAEKNRVNLATLEFARNNKATGLFEEIKPKAIGTSFDGDTPIIEQITDPSVLKIRENGKQVYLKIHDEGLAKMYQAIGQEKLPAVLDFVGGITRFYASLATRFNPEFVLSNKIRDLQEMMVNVSGKDGMGFKGAAKSSLRDPASMKAVTESMAGMDTKGAKLYEQMKMDGGTTGGMSLSTRKNLEIDVDKIQKINRSKPRKAAEMILNGIENWNTVFEDSTRLSIYKTALDNGLSREQAALLAKNATLNFNKKGTAGPIINSLYMFANASIQGTTNTLRAMKNPKVAATVTSLVGTATAVANNWNDQVDPDWRDKVSEWDRNANLVVMLPSTDSGANYMTIPVAWGVKPIKVMSDRMYELSQGKGDLLKAAGDVIGSAIDAYNPIGGTDLISTLTPTVGDMPVDLSRNKSWSGSLIKPDWMGGLPQADQYFDSLGQTKTGQALISATGKVSEATGRRIDISPQDLNYVIEQLIGGGGRFLGRSYDTAAGLAKGEEIPDKSIPFWNRFVKEKTEEEVKSSITKTERKETFEQFKQFKTGSEEQKQAIQEYLAGLPTDEDREREKFILSDNGFDVKGVSTSSEVIKMKPKYKEIQGLFEAGKEDEALDKINDLSKEEYTIYKRLKNQEKDEDAPTDEERFDSQYSNIQGSFEEKYQEMQKLRTTDKMSEYVEMEKRFAKELYEQYKDATPEEKAQAIAPFKGDKKFVEKFKSVVKEGSMSNTERDISNLGVRSGEKAQAVWEQIKDMPFEEQRIYLKNLKEKKIISAEVIKQLSIIKNSN